MRRQGRVLHGPWTLPIRAPTPDKRDRAITERLMGLALANTPDLQAARHLAAARLDLLPDGVGLVVYAGGPLTSLHIEKIISMPAKDVVALAARVGVDPTPEPSAWPVLILDSVDLCLGWFHDLPHSQEGA